MPRLADRRAAANTVAPQGRRAALRSGHAVETGLLDANPADRLAWRAPIASGAVNPQVVAGPAQAEAELAAADQVRPELAAFFGCVDHAALNSEEAVALRVGDCHLPARRGQEPLLSYIGHGPRQARDNGGSARCRGCGSAWRLGREVPAGRGIRRAVRGVRRREQSEIPVPSICRRVLATST